MRIKSFAKINLGIEVLGKRDDGYHEIRTLFQSVDLFDLLDFFPCTQDEIILIGDDDSILWDESNLVNQAATLLKERHAIKKGMEIHVKKNIPAGKGLGGGSSNAAMTLLALNKMWQINLEKNALKDLGAQIGADVPFFFEGGLCLGQGKGDILFQQEDPSPLLCLLVFPSVSVSTESAYERFRASLTSQSKESKIIKFLNSHDLGFLENDLEEIVFRTYPQIKAIKSLIQEQGSELTLMSGSGSAVFGLFDQRNKAMNALRVLSNEYTAVLTTTLSQTEYQERIRIGVSRQTGV
ncbi:MAG: 4-(cytidine 5'-diphospho)-2-C-methyl-D-erythritol kinase [Candidatus Aminicenantes bacterium]|nr:MAG: 4-(cytidine 5'-diphospho)-2-C-methyl-D-erythritol kinase [Candidatus Aminicenantes bacterium]